MHTWKTVPAIVAGTALLTSVPSSAVSAAQAAAMFRANAAHLGVYAGPAPTLRSVAWRFRTRGKIISSPVVAGDTVYVGSADGGLYAVNVADGTRRWRFATKGPISSSPAVGDGTVYFGSLDGAIYAVDAASGKQKWQFKTAGERRFTAPGMHGLLPHTEVMADPFDVLVSSPAIAGGTVFIGSGDHNVYALDAASGALRWKFRTGNVVHASPAVAGGVVYIGSWDRYLYALDARTGVVHWKFQTGDDRTIYNQVGIAGSAAVANGTVYVGCRDSKFYAIDAATGNLRWKHDEHGSWVIGSPAISGNSVYFTTSDEQKFFALDAATGRERFHVAYDTFSYSSPSLAGGIAYFGTFSGRLYGVDTSSGKVVARFMTDATRRNLPRYLTKSGAIDDRLIYDDPTLGGAYVGMGRMYELGAIAGSPVINAGTLYIGGGDGILYALR